MQNLLHLLSIDLWLEIRVKYDIKNFCRQLVFNAK